jgi:ABC-type glycerol-3-phosphate transport system substrate-binding protein
MKKIKMSFFLAFLLCLSASLLALFSCDADNRGQKSDDEKAQNPGSGDGEAADSAQDGEAAPDRLSVSDDLPDGDFGGSDFNILYLTWGTYTDYYWADEEIGEVMNDALYRRQRDTEERFDVKIEKIPTAYGTLMSTLGKSVKAGSHAYDMALTHCSNELSALITQNILMDWNLVPHLNFEKPWWSEKNAENEALSIGGKMYLVVSDFVIPDPNVTFFNKDLLQNLGLEDPYRLVRDGKWTYDKMHEMAKAAGKDLDGNGIMDNADQYGLVTQLDWYFNSVPNSAGVNYANWDENGRPVFTDAVERLHNALIAVDALVNDSNCTFAYAYGAMGDQYISALPLSTGRVLFHWDPLFLALQYRAIAFDYGILPWPKLDEAQSRYYHFSHNGFMVLPQTTPDLNKTGLIVEALSAMSYKYCIPAYYDVLMGIKLTRDLESVEMLDLVYKTCIFDPGRNLIEGDPMQYAFPTLLKSKSTDFVSYYEKNAGKTQAALDKFYDQALELE